MKTIHLLTDARGAIANAQTRLAHPIKRGKVERADVSAFLSTASYNIAQLGERHEAAIDAIRAYLDPLTDRQTAHDTLRAVLAQHDGGNA